MSTYTITKKDTIDFETLVFKSTQNRLIFEAETRLREEQRASEQRLINAFLRLESKFDEHKAEIKAELSEHKAEIKAEINRLDVRIDRLDGRIDRLDGKIDRLDSRFDEFKKWLIGIAAGVFIGVITMFLMVMLR